MSMRPMLNFAQRNLIRYVVLVIVIVVVVVVVIIVSFRIHCTVRCTVTTYLPSILINTMKSIPVFHFNFSII